MQGWRFQPIFAAVQAFRGIFLIGLLSFNFLTQLGILVNFSINQDYIAKVWCINKDKPEMACNGKCHLAKQLQESTPEKDTETPANKTDQVEPPLFVVDQILEAPATANQVASLQNSFCYINLYRMAWVDADVHPPETV